VKTSKDWKGIRGTHRGGLKRATILERKQKGEKKVSIKGKMHSEPKKKKILLRGRGELETGGRGGRGKSDVGVSREKVEKFALHDKGGGLERKGGKILLCPRGKTNK